jgi:outer membrane protein OmpA-like peptidoglycan-associated protein
MAVGSAFGLTTGNYNASVRGLTQQLQKEGVQVESIGDSVAVYIPSDLVFKPGTHDIKSSAYSVLTSVTAMSKLYVKSPGKIQVAGYTDNVMSRPENEKLSTQQAQSVVAYMWAEGIPHEVIAMQGVGERDPIANNVTSMGSAANRRIEVHFTTL